MRFAEISVMSSSAGSVTVVTDSVNNGDGFDAKGEAFSGAKGLGLLDLGLPSLSFIEIMVGIFVGSLGDKGFVNEGFRWTNGEAAIVKGGKGECDGAGER